MPAASSAGRTDHRGCSWRAVAADNIPKSGHCVRRWRWRPTVAAVACFVKLGLRELPVRSNQHAMAPVNSTCVANCTDNLFSLLVQFASVRSRLVPLKVAECSLDVAQRSGTDQELRAHAAGLVLVSAAHRPLPV